MMSIDEIFNLDDSSKIIEKLKQKNIIIPPWEDLIKQYDPLQHKIMSKALYPDKAIMDEKGNIIDYSPVTRVCIGLQKLAVNRMSEFMFTIPVNTINEARDDEKLKSEQFAAVKKVLKKNKWDTLNKKRCKINSSECEQATYWYVVKGKNNSYGFESDFKIKNTIFSPSKGDELYPLFDETGDMIAFSRQYKVKTNNKIITYFETWTTVIFIRWKQENAGWVEETRTENKIGKIPVIYSYRPKPIWDDGDNGKVHEIELLLSRNGDILSYHAAPVLVIKGKLVGAPVKGESNKVFVTEDATGGAEYVSWQQSPESTKFQFETLMRLFWTEMQLPDLSYENVKGIGSSISGVALEIILSDAHLKCGDESEIYEDLIEREYSIIRAYLGTINHRWNTSINDLELTPVIRPFFINDEKRNVEVLVTAKEGGIISQQTAVKLSNLTDDPKAEYLQIKAEYAEKRDEEIYNPTL